MGLAWLMIGGLIALVGIVLMIVIYGAGAVFRLVVWLLTQVGVLLIRLVGWIIYGCRRLIDHIRDARL